MSQLAAKPQRGLLRLRKYQTIPGHSNCLRCSHRLRVAPRFRYWRWVGRIWFALLAFSFPLQVVLAPLAAVLWPVWAALWLSIGPMNALAEQHDRCLHCGMSVFRLPPSASEPGADTEAPLALVVPIAPRLRSWRRRR